ncbi:hypothetical protein CR152_19810 [Massilia violaceinigra]|uniref:Uncharacterized protein n=1 Tax=Massilia violaceinigra TaxID=2045208 RepID=A0A2D2DNH0_9BURK|nr:hypothetical protein [Massilia violaceinigra]ATQ76511.1 hypothetical protein CR152_19810 [Massilia violaceinigra]
MRYKSSRPVPVSLTRTVLAIALIAVLVWGPIAVYCSWSIYFTQPSIWLGLAAAGMGIVLVARPMMRTVRRDIEMGTHASRLRGTRFSWVSYLAMLGITGLMFYGWMTCALWILAMLMSPPLVEREFRVGTTNECTGSKCNSCRYRAATLLRFESTDTDICVDEVKPALRQGERMIVRGYFHPLVIQIDSVRRAPAAPPAPMPTSRP